MCAYTHLHIASKIFNLTLEEVNNLIQKFPNSCVKFEGEILIEIDRLEKYLLADDISLSI